MQPTNPIARLHALWRGKVMARALFLIVVAALLAAVAAAFGIAHDYGYLHVSILTGSPGGQYHALAMRLSERARREHGTLTAQQQTDRAIYRSVTGRSPRKKVGRQ